MVWRCQECDYLGEEIVETNMVAFKICPECGGDCIESAEMTEEQESILENFFTNNLDSFVKPYQEELDHEESYDQQLLWEDFEAAKEVANRNGIFVYTVVECEDEEAWIIDGWHFVNRIGYFFTTKEINIPEEGIRYW